MDEDDNPEMEWPPQIFPPPEGTHPGCSMCEDSYYSIRRQEKTITFRDPTIRKDVGLYRNFIPDEHAQLAINKVRQEALDALAHVRDALRSHGDLILSRWTKKSKDKRGRLLNSASRPLFGVWPPHQPVLEFTKEEAALYGATNHTLLLGSGKGGAWITIEGFAEDRMKLLSLLVVRCSYAPHEWATFDSREMTHYFWAPTEQLRFNPKCVSMMEEDYGQLIDLDVDAIHSGAALGFPRAYATFCHQHEIATGLRAVVDMIIDGAPPSGTVKWDKLISDGLQSSAGEARWGIYDNQAFAPPTKFDPELLLDMARNQLNKVIDEAELLQGDLEFLRDYALTMKANISWGSSVSAALKWTYITSVITNLWTHKLSRWQAIFDKTQELVILLQGQDTISEAHSEFSEAAKKAMFDYGKLVQEMMEMQALNLFRAVTEMHATKDVFSRCEKDGEVTMPWKYDKDFKKPSNRIVFLMLNLYGRVPTRNLMRGTLNNISAELSKVRWDKRVHDELSTIGLLDTMRIIWSSAHVVSEGDLQSWKSIDETTERRMDYYSACHTALQSLRPFERKYPRLDSLLRELCERPWPRNRSTTAWLENMNEARRLQADIWKNIRENWQKDVHDLESNVVDAVVKNMSFDSSPRYIAEVKEQRAVFEEEMQQRLQTSMPTDQPKVQVLQSVWGDEPEASKPVRPKVKADDNVKAMDLDFATLTLNEHPEPDVPEAKLTIAVKQDSQRVFDRIFSRTATTSKFRWAQLVNALKDAGMVATQSSGSGVKFSNEQGSIVFHCPHGDKHDSALSAEFLRSEIGKRLTKWFGWDSETFVERTKDE